MPVKPTFEKKPFQIGSRNGPNGPTAAQKKAAGRKSARSVGNDLPASIKALDSK